MTYVSIDLDWPSKLQIIETWHRLKKHTEKGPEGRLSASGHGVHIRSHRVLPETVGVAEKERIHAGDDMDRLQADVAFPNAPNQLLWDTKDGETAGGWTRTLHKLISRYDRSVALTPTQYRAKHD
jgi:hypothetical protein